MSETNYTGPHFFSEQRKRNTAASVCITDGNNSSGVCKCYNFDENLAQSNMCVHVGFLRKKNKKTILYIYLEATVCKIQEKHSYKFLSIVILWTLIIQVKTLADQSARTKHCSPNLTANNEILFP